jgi:hypothetical protein
MLLLVLFPGEPSIFRPGFIANGTNLLVAVGVLNIASLLNACDQTETC